MTAGRRDEVALVTGAGRGLGRAVALELARAGYDVVATMRHTRDGDGLADQLAAQGPAPGRLTVAHLDLTDPSSMSLPGDLRVLVNNAGIERRYLPVESVPLEEWREVFETNVFGLVELTRRAVPLLRANGGGVICNITSSSLVVSAPFYAVYRASKAAVQAMGESLRAEVAPFGIRVVEVLPGPVETDMLEHSARMPEAHDVDGYRDLAAAWHQGRLSVEGMTTPVGEAARAVVAAISSDDSRLRWACDDLGGQIGDAWRRDPEGTLGAW